MNPASNTNTNFIYLLYIKQYFEINQRSLFSSTSEYNFYYHATVPNIVEKLQQYQERFALSVEWAPRIRMYKILQECSDLYSLSVVPRDPGRPQMIYARRTVESCHFDERKETNFFRFSLPVINSRQIQALVEEDKQNLNQNILDKIRSLSLETDSSEKGRAIAELNVEFIKYNIDLHSNNLPSGLKRKEITQKRKNVQEQLQSYGVNNVMDYLQPQMQRDYLSKRRKFTYFLFPSPSFSRNNAAGHEFTPVLENCKKIKTLGDVKLDRILGMRDETKIAVQKLIKSFLKDIHAKEVAFVTLLPLTERAVVLRFSKD